MEFSIWNLEKELKEILGEINGTDSEDRFVEFHTQYNV
jgi:hypothetical protein